MDTQRIVSLPFSHRNLIALIAFAIITCLNMFLKKLSRAAFLLILILAMLPLGGSSWQRNAWNGQFGYGVRISLNDPNLNQTLTCVSKLALVGYWLTCLVEFVPRQGYRAQLGCPGTRP